MKNRRLLLLPSAALLLAAAFMLLDFRLARSDTQAVQMITSTELKGGYPQRLQPTDPISLVMIGEGPLLRPLQQTLAAKISEARMGQIHLEQALQPAYPNPVLVMNVGQPNLVWTPFYARGQFLVSAGYAINGDITFLDHLDKTKPYIRNPDPSAVYLYTEFNGSDRSFGLISRPGYYQHLADYLTKNVIETLKGLYNIQDPGGG